jgi:hypothetical protein
LILRKKLLILLLIAAAIERRQLRLELKADLLRGGRRRHEEKRGDGQPARPETKLPH